MSLNSKPTKTTPNRLVLSTKYCDTAHKIRRSLNDCWRELHKTEDLREIFPNPLCRFQKTSIPKEQISES